MIKKKKKKHEQFHVIFGPLCDSKFILYQFNNNNIINVMITCVDYTGLSFCPTPSFRAVESTLYLFARFDSQKISKTFELFRIWVHVRFNKCVIRGTNKSLKTL